MIWFAAGAPVDCAAAPVQAPDRRDVTAPAPRAVTSGPETLERNDPALRASLDAVRTSRTCDTLSALANRYAALGVRDAAGRHFTDAIDLEPRCAAAHDGLARLWRDAGMAEMALGSAHRATYFAPDSAPFANTYGTVLQAMGRTADAAEAYRRVLQIDRTAAYAHSNLCYLSVLAAKFESAEADCLAALEAVPSYAPALNNLALVRLANGQPERAFELFASAGGTAAAHYNMGVVHQSLGDYAAALREFESAYRVDPALDSAHARARSMRRLIQKQSEPPRVHDRRR